MRSALAVRSTVAMDGDPNDDWPPPEARVRAAVWEAESHLERGEYVAAARALERVSAIGDEFVHGLHHLAAAGYRSQTGELVRARRQIQHARRRLARHPDTAPLLKMVETVVESADAGGELA